MEENEKTFIEVHSTYDGEESHCMVTKDHLYVRRNEKIILKLVLNSVCAVHRLSSFEKKGKCGVAVGYICAEKKKFTTHEVECHERNEEKLVKIVEQLAMFEKVSVDYQLLNKRSRRILILVNPFSGTKKGVKTFNTKIKPVLDYSRLSYKVIVTKRAGHAFDICRTLDLEEYNEIALVSGDGLFNEVLNGLMHHVDVSCQASNIPICMFPCGTGNGIAAEIGTENDVMMATLMCCRGKSTRCDVSSVFHDGKRYYSALSITTSVVADVDTDCQCLRFIGAIRDVVTSVYCIIGAKYYDTEITYVQDVDQEETAYDDPPKEKIFKSVWSDPYRPEFKEKDEDEEEEEEEDEGEEENSEEDSDQLIEEKIEKGVACPLIKKHFMNRLEEIAPNYAELFEDHRDRPENRDGQGEEEEISIEQQEIEEEEEEEDTTFTTKWNNKYFLLSFCNLKKYSHDVWGAGFAHMCNGFMDIIAVSKPLSRLRLILTFIPMLGETPEHMKIDFVKSVRVRAAYVHPKEGKHIVVDGEEVTVKNKFGPFLFEVHKGLARLMHM